MLLWCRTQGCSCWDVGEAGSTSCKKAMCLVWFIMKKQPCVVNIIIKYFFLPVKVYLINFKWLIGNYYLLFSFCWFVLTPHLPKTPPTFNLLFLFLHVEEKQLQDDYYFVGSDCSLTLTWTVVYWCDILDHHYPTELVGDVSNH